MGPAIVGARQCRMHGGRSPGAPRGNRNAVTHGFYTKEARASREREKELMRQAKALVAEND
jgi:uncharacterized protein YjcR